MNALSTLSLIPVILSGGAGTRLWPVSREAHPKPFIQLPDGQSLLEKTYRRCLALHSVAEILTVTHRDYYFRCKDEWQLALNHCRTKARYLLEPFGRNTAPAITLAALDVLAHHGESAVMLVLPSDHLVPEVNAFAATVEKAVALAQQGFLVTFGIQPTAPETGFGYIQQGVAIDSLGYQVQRFVEKPELITAQAYVESGEYSWNAGIFCFKAIDLIQAISEYAPSILQIAQTIQNALTSESILIADQVEFPADLFQEFENISIDYAIMEQAKNIAVVKANFEWNDIGSWNALANLTPKNEQGNQIQGQVISLNTYHSYLHSESRMIATIGVNHLVVIDTEDALLIADREQLQSVKEVVNQLKLIGHESALIHRTIHRPWGFYTVLEQGVRFKIKRIEVKPNASLSLQMHHHRSEHWTVISGTATVTHGKKQFLLRPDESTYIPAGDKHRLQNQGVIPLVIIEVQTGDYVGEDDIVRFEDHYGR
ncbi:MAG: Alginate biosynthesis protein AlgA [Pseudomonadota bacterium]|jgi:mannose-1-phosphate guanylyltransferase